MVGCARLILSSRTPFFCSRQRLDADHPDRNGEQLRKIAPVLKIFAEKAKEFGGKVGVFIDYCSLPQRSRASHRAGAAAAEAARAAAKAAGADAEAQNKAAAKAHKSKDDRTPEELATFSAADHRSLPFLCPLRTVLTHRAFFSAGVDSGWCSLSCLSKAMPPDRSGAQHLPISFPMFARLLWGTGQRRPCRSGSLATPAPA